MATWAECSFDGVVWCVYVLDGMSVSAVCRQCSRTVRIE